MIHLNQNSMQNKTATLNFFLIRIKYVFNYLTLK